MQERNIISHTLRGCVDWNNIWAGMRADGVVTPCVGVWIETLLWGKNKRPNTSHPAWVCGLKHLLRWWFQKGYISHTLRGCVDWNWNALIFPTRGFVTPCVGVWIETARKIGERNRRTSHTLRGCVDWNHLSVQSIHSSRGHTLRGCVDWNRKLFLKFIKSLESHPAWVCGLKLGEPPAIIIILQSHPAWVCGLKHPYYNRE